MSEAALRRLTLDEFEAWQAHQEVRCELVDGRPMAVTGATFAHDIVVSNLLRALGNALSANRSECRAFTADIGLVTGPHTLRRPDVAVYCPPFDLRASRSTNPTLATEVLSPSTQQIDMVTKLEKYRALPAITSILLLEPERVDVGVWQRSGDAWSHRRLTDDLHAVVDVAGLGLTLRLRNIYDGAQLVAVRGPHLVWPDAPAGL